MLETHNESRFRLRVCFRSPRQGDLVGNRGRLPGSTYGNPGGRTRAKTPALLPVQSLEVVIPPPPDHLSEPGAEIWSIIHEHMPALQSSLDSHTVQRYCEAAEDLVRARAEIEHRGLLLEEPIVSPRGDVVGTRVVLNPAEAALRRADKVLDGLCDRLGLSPQARERGWGSFSIRHNSPTRRLIGSFRPCSDP